VKSGSASELCCWQQRCAASAQRAPTREPQGYGLPQVAAGLRGTTTDCEDEARLKWIDADLLHPDERKEQVEVKLQGAELVCALAASIPFSRHLALDAKGTGQRVGEFLNPRGMDLAVLAEELKRIIGFDCLEMQYYRALCRTAGRQWHGSSPDGHFRYAVLP
jgi:hypothetical protein